jgi:hypothetical protein
MCWLVDDRDTLIGGFLYLHTTSNEGAGFGGRVISAEDWPHRASGGTGRAFVFEPIKKRGTGGVTTMTKIEKLQRDIETMRESILLQRRELAGIPLSDTAHHAANAAIHSLVDELKRLLEDLDQERGRAKVAGDHS